MSLTIQQPCVRRVPKNKCAAVQALGYLSAAERWRSSSPLSSAYEGVRIRVPLQWRNRQLYCVLSFAKLDLLFPEMHLNLLSLGCGETMRGKPNRDRNLIFGERVLDQFGTGLC